MNVTPDAVNQIELIDDDQVNAWLRLSQCSIFTVACFLHRAAVAPRDGGDPVRPNTPLARHNLAISTPDNSMLQSSTLSQIPTLMCRRMPGVRLSAGGPFPGLIRAGRGGFRAMIARSLDFRTIADR